MKISYESYVNGTIEIPDDELEGKTKAEREDLISEYVTAHASEDLDTNLDWEICDDE